MFETEMCRCTHFECPFDGQQPKPARYADSPVTQKTKSLLDTEKCEMATIERGKVKYERGRERCQKRRAKREEAIECGEK